MRNVKEKADSGNKRFGDHSGAGDSLNTPKSGSAHLPPSKKSKHIHPSGDKHTHPRATLTENDGLCNRTSRDVGVYVKGVFEGGEKRSARVDWRVRPSAKEKFVGLCRLYGVTQCVLFEALTEGLHSAEHGGAEMMPFFGNRYYFPEVNIIRVTKELVRTMRGLKAAGETQYVFHGSLDKCWGCEEKPTVRHCQGTTWKRIHVFYCCPNHVPRPPGKLQVRSIKKL